MVTMSRFMKLGSAAVAQVKALVASETAAGVFITPKANPATCTKGALNVDASGDLNVCSATNTWTVVGTQS